MRVYSGPPLEVSDVNLVQVLFAASERRGEHPCYRVRENGATALKTLGWSEVATLVRDTANGLLSLNVGRGDRVLILSDTRAEWVVADYAALATGGITVTAFSTLTAEQVLFLLQDSGPKIVFVENREQYDKVRQIADRATSVEHWVVFEDVQRGADGLGKHTLLLAELQVAGRAYSDSNPTVLDVRVREVKPDDVATIIYTSGTTGVPKGAMLTHRNVVASVKASVQALGLEKHPVGLAFLPLAHAYQRQSGFLVTELEGEVTFSTPATLGDDLRAARPTLIACVPRLYERMYDQIQAKVAELPARRQGVFRTAAHVARAYGKAISDGGSPGVALRLQHAVFDRLVYSKLRESLGVTRLRLASTGAAAIRPDLLHFFQGIGVNVLEGYGLTETTAPSNTNPPHRFRPGTVGPTYPGMEQAVAADGEVLMRGPNVFAGYWNRPEETEDAFVTVDGKKWFRSGDVGEFDDAGYLRIVDRKKEIEVLDTGKKIAPVAVEEGLKASSFVMEAMLVATGRKFAGALIQPDFDRLVTWAEANRVPFDRSKLVVAPDPTGRPTIHSVGRDLLDHPDVQALYRGEVERINLAFADFERVKAFRIVDRAFSVASGELTPTLKKKRRVIAARYTGLIEEMFQGPKG